jgi:hypothetical protein
VRREKIGSRNKDDQNCANVGATHPCHWRMGDNLKTSPVVLIFSTPMNHPLAAFDRRLARRRKMLMICVYLILLALAVPKADAQTKATVDSDGSTLVRVAQLSSACNSRNTQCGTQYKNCTTNACTSAGGNFDPTQGCRYVQNQKTFTELLKICSGQVNACYAACNNGACRP